MLNKQRNYSRISPLACSIALLFIVAVTSTMSAQTAAGKIVGTITDQQGAAMPGVKIAVKNVATGVVTNDKTENDGTYQVLNLPIGKYEITAEKDGFRKIVTAPQTLQINQALRINLQMQIGSRDEAVTVEDVAAGVETVNSTLGQVVTSRAVVDMPLNGRRVLDLALLQPGVTEVNQGARDGGQAGTFGIAGSKSDSITFLLDGGLNNDLLSNGAVFTPNPDTIAEFRLLTSNYSAEYGRNAGGVISVVTKSGTNSIHGSGFDFLRNDVFNANSFFNNRQGLRRENLKRNQFGATIGGPIKKDKIFWFASYGGQRETTLQTGRALTVYTPLEIKGDFSQSPKEINPNLPDGSPNPYYHAVRNFLAAYPYYQPNAALAAQGIIDPTRINPTAQKYIAAGLVPTSSTGSLSAQGTRIINQDQVTGKFDANPTEKDKIAITLGWARNPQQRPFASSFGSSFSDSFGYGGMYSDNQSFLNAAYTHTFSEHLLNEFRFTAQRLNHKQAYPTKTLPTASALGIGVTPDDPTGPPRIGFDQGQVLGFSPQGPTNEIDNTFAFTDTVSWAKGRHNIKFGFLYSPYQNNTVYDFYVNGEFDFYGASGCTAGSCNDFADFLFGLPDEYFQFGRAPSNIRSKSYYGFAQDEWRVNNRLTLTLGLRYEYNSPKRDTQGRSFSLLPGVQSQRFVNAPKGLLFPGDPQAPDGANFPDHNDFAPRFGFAFDPTGSGKTSIRGGIGVFYDVLKGEDNLQYNGQAPFFGYADLFFPPLAGNPAADPGFFSDPFGVTGATNPFPSKPPAKDIDFDASGFLPFGGGGVYFVDPHLRTPYTYQYNLSVQRELSSRLIAEVAYVGSDTHKQTSLIDSNPFVIGTYSRVFNTQAGVPSYGFSYLDTFGNLVNAHYNSLQASLTKQLTQNRWVGGSYFTLSYTWGKSIDNASGFRNNSGRVAVFDHNYFRSVSDYDVNHRVVFSGGWDLPFNELFNSGPKVLTKGWSVYPIVTFRTGFPVDVRAGYSRSRTRAGSSGYGDGSLTRVNLNGSSVTTFDPRSDPNFDPYSVLYVSKSNFNRNGMAASYLLDINDDPCTKTSVMPMGSPPCFNPVLYPEQRTYGSLPRNFFRGPNRSNFDFAIAKKTPITERVQTEFRAEFFNILNHAQFDDPVTNFTDDYFGKITSTADPRIIQFALRFSF